MTSLIIGVGNRDRGDDAVGPLVVDHFRVRYGEQAETMILEGDLSDLALRWAGDRPVVLIDAIRSGRPAGTIVEIDGLSGQLPAHGRPVSSHGVGVPDAIELARRLDRLPRSLVILGVEGASFEHFAPLTEAVSAAVPRLTERAHQLLLQ